MGLTLAERRAITETAATRYRLAGKRGKSRILDELCANTGWHRSHARKALAAALQAKIIAPRRARPVKYGPDVIAALTVCWTVLGMPAGKRLAPMMGELVPRLRHFGELDIDEDTAALLVAMSPATIDRRLAGTGQISGQGACRTKPGSLLKYQIPSAPGRNGTTPARVRRDRPGRPRGRQQRGEHAFTLTVTDIATGWTENRSVRNKAEKWVLEALDTSPRVPVPDHRHRFRQRLGIHQRAPAALVPSTKITFTRSRPGTRTTAPTWSRRTGRSCEPSSATTGRHRRRTLVLNEIWQLQSMLTNYFCPQQKLISKIRNGAKVTKKYDKATTPFRRRPTTPHGRRAHRRRRPTR